jgi:hypothetical protein
MYLITNTVSNQYIIKKGTDYLIKYFQCICESKLQK